MELMNDVWIKGEMPMEWRQAIICPLYKGGEKSEVKNYREITLCCTAYKIYAMVLEGRMTKIVEEKGFLGDWQVGFRKGRGTMDNIYMLHTLVEKEISKVRGKVMAFFIDLKAAFDSLDRKELIKELQKC